MTLALDWTPNINHIGFVVAQEKGFYRDAGIDLTIYDPSQDNYALTPAKKLERGLVDLAIAPTESVISLNYKDNPVAARAVYAILQEDLSSIAVRADSNITRPRELAGQTYASYGARYEDHIVRQMILNDGGEGSFEVIYPEKLGIWDTLLAGTADATWIFDNWEGIEAAAGGVELNRFRLRDYGIPYGYSPVVLTTQERIAEKAAALRGFLAATRKGFLYAAANRKEAAATLLGHLSERERTRIDVEASLDLTADFFGDATTAGRMDPGRMARFLDWLVAHGIESERIKETPLFTNELLG